MQLWPCENSSKVVHNKFRCEILNISNIRHGLYLTLIKWHRRCSQNILNVIFKCHWTLIISPSCSAHGQVKVIFFIRTVNLTYGNLWTLVNLRKYISYVKKQYYNRVSLENDKFCHDILYRAAITDVYSVFWFPRWKHLLTSYSVILSIWGKIPCHTRL